MKGLCALKLRLGKAAPTEPKILHDLSNTKGTPVSSDLKRNQALLSSKMHDSSDIVKREFILGGTCSTKCLLIFIGGLVDETRVDMTLRDLVSDSESLGAKPDWNTRLQNISSISVSKIEYIEQAIAELLSGTTLLFVDGQSKAFGINARHWEKRGLEAPSTEPSIAGPMIGFIEDLQTNTAMIRRRIKSPTLAFDKFVIGRLSRTDVVMAYLDGYADNQLVEEMAARLDRIAIDDVEGTGVIAELIQDAPYSIFPTVKTTERIDRAVSSLVQGKIVILIDGSPFAIVMPARFFESLAAAEDYYERYWFATVARILRYFSMLVALGLPGLYVATTTFHQEMLPTPLAVAIASEREAAPFPAAAELLVLAVMFEILREAGVRLPRQVGAAVSIVGALILGETAIRANLVTSPTVIVTAFVAISVFIFPQYAVGQSLTLARLGLLILSASFGLVGLISGFLALIAHLVSLRSLGVPYLSPVAPAVPSEYKDTLVRSPWWKMTTTPQTMHRKHPQREEAAKVPRPPKDLTGDNENE